MHTLQLLNVHVLLCGDSSHALHTSMETWEEKIPFWNIKENGISSYSSPLNVVTLWMLCKYSLLRHKTTRVSVIFKWKASHQKLRCCWSSSLKFTSYFLRAMDQRNQVITFLLHQNFLPATINLFPNNFLLNQVC